MPEERAKTRDEVAFKHVRGGNHALVEAGRTLEQTAEDIRREGIFFTPAVLRRSIIGGLEIRRQKGNAENAIIIGCACFGTAMALRSFCLFMQRLGIDYVFLEKEYCCGAQMVHTALRTGQDRTFVDQCSKEFTALNIELCHQKGAKNIVFFCPWCVYIARRFYPDEPGLLFYPQILKQHIDKIPLKLERRVGYFGGSPHRRAVYLPDESFDLDWDDFPLMLGKVQGLEVVNIPRYCCQIRTELIYEYASKQGLDTIVVSCVVCYGRMMRTAPPGIKVRYVTDVLLEAAGGPAT